MNGRIRPAALQDLGSIDRLFHQAAGNGVAGQEPLRWPQFPSVRVWFLLNRTLSSILPIASPANHLYVFEEDRQIRGFVQAEAGAGGRHVWQILNLCLPPAHGAIGIGLELLDRLFQEGLKRGVTKYFVRIPLDDPIVPVFQEKRFIQYATEHVLFAEGLPAVDAAAPRGLRGAHGKDLLGLYLLYRATAPKRVSSVEGASLKEWRATFHQGWLARIGRPGNSHQVVDLGGIVAWIGVAAGSSTRPHTLGFMVHPELADAAGVVDHALGQMARRHPGPVWCNLRDYDARLIELLKRRGFQILASQILMVKELPIKVRVKEKRKEKGLVPQFG